MPRTADHNKQRSPFAQTFVDRLEWEMSERSLSDRQVADLASKRLPVSGATVWKVRHAEPPRKLALDEADAIAQGLGYDGIEDFLYGGQLREVADTIKTCQGNAEELSERAVMLRQNGDDLPELLDLLDESPAQLESPARQRTVSDMIIELHGALDTAQSEMELLNIPAYLDTLKAALAKIHDRDAE